MESIETPRLVLRPITLGDIDLLVQLDADPEVMRYISGGRPSTPTEIRQTVEESLGHRWIASERATDDFIGWFSLRPSAPAEAELGYRLRRQAWGRGNGSGGVRALIDYGFREQKLDRIWAQTMTVNVNSRRVMEACGMRHVRTFHFDWGEVIDGSEEGDVEYELLRENQWLNLVTAT
jgi:RimJ/RimL family protein N-acetyltransferase